MEADFWHERWAMNQIGFHQAEVNRLLRKHFERVRPAPGGHVLVPMCGKSLDMLYLRDEGMQVCGVELNEQACRDFFDENDLACTLSERDGFRVFSGDRIELLCGDFLRTGPSHFSAIDAVYDRAALVALPPAMRQSYARHLCGLLSPGVKMLLVTLDYDQDQMKGPPFAVSANEVRQLYEPACKVGKLAGEDCLAAEPRFREKGLSRLEEAAWLLERKA